jgi:multidrug efflux pump subunit AcrA (membrane-fusion protein)
LRPPFRVRKKRPVGRIALLLVAVAVGAAAAAVKLRPAAVTTTPIVRGTAVEAVYATGTVEPFDRVIVKAKAAGAIDLKVREGAIVKKGDLLATIDSATMRHELERGRADMWAASQQATNDGPQLAALEAQARSLQAEMNTVQTTGRAPPVWWPPAPCLRRSSTGWSTGPRPCRRSSTRTRRSASPCGST